MTISIFCDHTFRWDLCATLLHPLSSLVGFFRFRTCILFVTTVFHFLLLCYQFSVLFSSPCSFSLSIFPTSRSTLHFSFTFSLFSFSYSSVFLLVSLFFCFLSFPSSFHHLSVFLLFLFLFLSFIFLFSFCFLFLVLQCRSPLFLLLLFFAQL